VERENQALVTATHGSTQANISTRRRTPNNLLEWVLMNTYIVDVGKFNKMKKINISQIIVPLVVIGICWGIQYYFRPLKPLPNSKLIQESTSPNGTYSVRAYVSNTALSPDTVWCEFVVGNKKPKVFYFQYRASNCRIDWDDDDTVIINGMRLKLPYSFYKGERD
jgi:hypothetical protein